MSSLAQVLGEFGVAASSTMGLRVSSSLAAPVMAAGGVIAHILDGCSRSRAESHGNKALFGVTMVV